ncbi:GTPase IMAP family member 7-like [Stigmatopora argus]
MASGVTWRQELRLVLLGNTGAGKSASGNTILGQDQFFKSELSFSSLTQNTEYGTAELVEAQGRKRKVTVVDMPGFGDTRLTEEEVFEEIAKCIVFSKFAPNAFFLVVPIGRFTKNEMQPAINLAKLFGNDALRYHTVVLFTGGDRLRGKTFEEYLSKAPPSLRELIHKCGGRYHVFNNENSSDRQQVHELMAKVDQMLMGSRTGFYTNEMFERAKEAVRKEQISRSGSNQKGSLDKWWPIVKCVVRAGFVGLCIGALFGAAVGGVVASTVATTLTKGVVTGLLVGGGVGATIGVVAGFTADSPEDAAQAAYDQVSDLGLRALKTSIVIKNMLGKAPCLCFQIGDEDAIDETETDSSEHSVIDETDIHSSENPVIDLPLTATTLGDNKVKVVKRKHKSSK